MTGCMVVEDHTHTGDNTSTGNGIKVEETRSLSSFYSLETNDDIQVSVREGSRFEVVVIADENLSAYISTQVYGNRLSIGWTRSVHTRVTPKVLVTVPMLDEVRHYGSALVEIEQTTWRREMHLELFGSGSLYYIGGSTKLTSIMHGSGKIDMSGYADILDLRNDASGDLLTDNLLSVDAFVEIYGAGDVTLNLDKGAVLTAHLFSSGNVEWWGFPSKTVYQLSGTGKIIEHRMLGKVAAQNSPAQRFKALKPQ